MNTGFLLGFYVFFIFHMFSSVTYLLQEKHLGKADVLPALGILSMCLSLYVASLVKQKKEQLPSSLQCSWV